MNIEKMTYSWRKVRNCIDMCKGITWSVDRKIEHFAKACEVKKIFEYAEENLNRFLFDTALYAEPYLKAAYNHKIYSKQELDSMLKQCKNYLAWELSELYNDMMIGDVNTED